MKTVEKNISLAEIKAMAQAMFGDLVKVVVDLEKQIMVVNAELHADEEALLLANGSKQQNLWGINLYPELFNTPDFIEFDSMINVRPRLQNMSRDIENEVIRKKVVSVVRSLITL